MKRIAIITAAGFLAALALAGPLDRPKPSSSLAAAPEAIKAGESSTLTWSCANAAKAVLAWADKDGATGTEAVPLAGTKVVTPAKTTMYRLYASRGWRSTYAQAGVDVTGDTPEPPTPDPAPTPTPPAGNSTLSAIGIGSQFSLSATLARASADHDLRLYVQSQGGTWAVIDPLMLEADHPPVLDSWVKVLTDSGKKQPAVIWYQKADGKTKVLAVDEVSDKTTGAGLLTLAKSHVPVVAGQIVVNGKTRALGLRPAKKGAFKGPSVSQILTPLAAADYPVGVDLRGQFAYRKDQGPNGTCVSQAFSAAKEAACFRAFGAANSVEFSPNFLATQIDGWNGAWAKDAADAISSIGIVTMADQPDYSHKLPSNWKAKAAQHRALGVYGPPEKNPRGYVAAAIARGLPVCVGISVGNGFEPDSEGYITYARGAGGSVNHEIIICGGWVQHDGRKFVLLKNSWGAGWGTFGDGCCYVEERFLDDDTDLWVIVVPSAAESYQFDPTPETSPASGRPRAGRLLESPIQAALDAARTVPADNEAPSPRSDDAAVSSCPACANGQCGQSRGGIFRRR